MSALKLVKQSLSSRGIRAKLNPNKGKRSLDLKHAITRPDQKNIIDRIGDFFNNSGLTGFISGTLNLLGWAGGGLVTGIFSWVVGRVEQLKSFNWNASDKELEDMMESQNVRIASIWGSALGRGAGWLSGIAIGYGISYLCPVIGGAALAKTVATNVGKEGMQEVSRGLGDAVLQTFGAIGNTAMVSAYINYRKLLKSIPDNVLTSIYGKSTADFIKNNWAKEGQPQISFNSVMDEFVESIQNKKLRAFVESFLEEAWDSFSEAGYIIAYELDSAYAQAKRANEQNQGKRRTIRLIPDKRRPDEQMLLSAGSNDIETEALSTLNNYRLISNRDVGQIVGMPAEDYLSAKPLRRQLTIVFKTKKEPPWKMPDGKQAKNRTVVIPDADLGLTWAKIKLAARPYTWGKFRATAHLDNGRQMAVYGATKSEAEKTLRRLAELSTAKILALNVTEEVEKRNLNLKKQAMQVYPAYATLLVRRPTTGEGRNFTDGTKLDEDRIRLDLWPNEAPKGTPPLK